MIIIYICYEEKITELILNLNKYLFDKKNLSAFLIKNFPSIKLFLKAQNAAAAANLESEKARILANATEYRDRKMALPEMRVSNRIGHRFKDLAALRADTDDLTVHPVTKAGLKAFG